jgi:hypothetical protein
MRLDSMALFRILEAGLCLFYSKCGQRDKMPRQHIRYPDLAKNIATSVATPERVAEIAQRDGTSDDTSASGESTSKERSPRVTVYFIPHKMAHHDFTPAEGPQEREEENAARRDLVPQVVLHRDFMPHPLRRAYHHWALTHRTFASGGGATLHHISTTEDIWQFSASQDVAGQALRRAKALISNVLRANSLEPNWDLDVDDVQTISRKTNGCGVGFE